MPYCPSLSKNSGFSPSLLQSDWWIWDEEPAAEVVPLGKEGDRLAALPRNFLAAVFDDRVPVGHGHGLGVADIDLFLARGRLALGILDRDAGALKTVADRTHHVLFLGRLEDVVILVVAACELQIAVSGEPRIVVGLIEEEEFEFACHEGFEAHGFEARYLRLQDGARRMRHLRMCVMVQHVAENQRRAVEPRNAPKRRKVRLHGVVAVTLVPARRLVTGHRLHFHICREQVIAAMRFLPRTFHEVFRVKTLSHQTALHIHLAGEHRVDAALGHILFQFVERIAHESVVPCLGAVVPSYREAEWDRARSHSPLLLTLRRPPFRQRRSPPDGARPRRRLAVHGTVAFQRRTR